jgi:Putative auto-transporter adhesin, head GIN domain
MRKVIIIALAIGLLASSCVFVGGKRIKGNGVIKTDTRDAGTFHSVEAGGSFDIYLKQDSVYSVKLEGDDNLLPYIKLENRNGLLKIYKQSNVRLRPTRAIKIFISAPTFKEVKSSGASDIYSQNTLTSKDQISIRISGAGDMNLTLDAPVVKAGLSGAGTIILKGRTRDFEVSGSGSSNINSYELLAENTSVQISGAGDAKVFASVKLVVSVSGAADVRYKGNATVEKQISGAGSVTKED